MKIAWQRVLLWLLIALYSWIEGGLRTFTMPAVVLVGMAVTFFLGFGLILSLPASALPIVRRTIERASKSQYSATSRSSDGEKTSTVRPITLASWLVVALTVTAFELMELFQLPRKTHPTISSLIVPLLAHSHLLHSLAFFAWLIAAWWIVRDWAEL
ncbi:MAG: hypothetical protein M1131_04465 [Actinobacteria bacterium]|nr:hypothetical protein [Actinomycetota bacterium]MCL6094674.1 hypothetical protein [Actinomycetota bacterium]